MTPRSISLLSTEIFGCAAARTGRRRDAAIAVACFMIDLPCLIPLPTCATTYHPAQDSGATGRRDTVPPDTPVEAPRALPRRCRRQYGRPIPADRVGKIHQD